MNKLRGMGFAWLAAVLVAGVAGRFWLGSLGHNYDYDSYRIVVDICEQGKNVYASTHRYNYGPVWFNTLHLLDLLSGHNEVVFRWLLIGLLTAADAGISFVLWRKFGPLAATLFFLNPVSMMISGFNNMFDNVAILFGLWSVLLFGDEFEKPLGRRKYAALAMLGLSLMTKHILFAFPFWLAVKQRGLLQKFLIMAIPTGIFLAGFLPYWPAGHAGIVGDVFEYQSNQPAIYYQYFYNELLPDILRSLADAETYWLLLLVLFAFVYRTKNSLNSLLFYTAVMLAFTPYISCEYFAIPMAWVCTTVNPLTLCYLGFAALDTATYGKDPWLFKNISGRFDDFAIYFLILSLIWPLWRRPILQAVQICRREINRQFGDGD